MVFRTMIVVSSVENQVTLLSNILSKRGTTKNTLKYILKEIEEGTKFLIGSEEEKQMMK